MKGCTVNCHLDTFTEQSALPGFVATPHIEASNGRTERCGRSFPSLSYG